VIEVAELQPGDRGRDRAQHRRRRHQRDAGCEKARAVPHQPHQRRGEQGQNATRHQQAGEQQSRVEAVGRPTAQGRAGRAPPSTTPMIEVVVSSVSPT
jgi:hypothetical protein